MKRLLCIGFSLALLSFVGACGDDGTTPTADAPVGGGADAPVGGPDGGGGNFVPLITGSWTIPPGQEIYHCVRYTVPQDMWITEFHPIIPVGTHHTVLTVDNPGTPDGEYPCNVAENGNKRGLYGTGVGANPFILPAGVAMKISAGEQLVLNLHLYNTDDADLTGLSGVEVRTVAQADVVHEADSDIVGKIFLVVPPGENTQTSSCTVSGPVTLFAVSPHMHKLGTHARAIAQVGGSPVTLHDSPYLFDEQLVYVLPSVVNLAAGDTMTLDCSYNNTTGATVTFGESSNDEMCFLGIYRYPAGAGGVQCN